MQPRLVGIVLKMDPLRLECWGIKGKKKTYEAARREKSVKNYRDFTIFAK